MKRTIPVVIVILVLGGLITWRLIQKHAATAALNAQQLAKSKAAPPVTTAQVAMRDIVNTYEASGSLEAPLNVKIAPQVSGRILFLDVHEGDHISKGQVLVRLDPAEVQGEVRQAESNLAEAQYRLAQAQISQAPNDVQVQTQVQSQEAAVATAQSNLNQATQNYNAQVAAADAAVNDAQGRIDQANGTINNAKAAIVSAQANLANAEAFYTRENELYKQGFLAAQDADNARTARDVAQAQLGEMQAQLTTASSTRDSYVAEKTEAVRQAQITRTSGQASIDSARQGLNQARAALVFATSNLAQKPAYQAGLAALNSAVRVAAGALASARADLAYTTLISPLDGYVTNRYMDPGAMATPGNPILGVQFFRQVWLSVMVPEEVSSTLHIGQPTSVTFDALPGQTFDASVIQINPGGDPTSRQFTVRAVLSNTTGQLKPGMFAHVVLETQRVPGAITVPREAVNQDASGSYVMVVEKGKARRQAVTVGASDPTYLQITSGLTAGEAVITISALPIREGQAVTVSQDQALTGAAQAAPVQGAVGLSAPATAGARGAGSGMPATAGARPASGSGY
jgi:RND family efflux transporter MFP subunit